MKEIKNIPFEELLNDFSLKCADNFLDLTGAEILLKKNTFEAVLRRLNYDKQCIEKIQDFNILLNIGSIKIKRKKQRIKY